MKKLAFLTSILLYVASIAGQNKFLESEKDSKELIEYKRITQYLTPAEYKKLSIRAKKQLTGLSFLLRVKNPIKSTLIKSFGDWIFTGPEKIDYAYSSKKADKRLFDIYWGPHLVIGKIIQQKRIKKEIIEGQVTSVLFEYTMRVHNSLNKYSPICKGDIIKFYFPTGHRRHTINPENSNLQNNKKYLVFINTKLNNYGLENLSSLPTVVITRTGDEGFRQEKNYIIDTNHYFSEKDKISISDVQKEIDKTIKQIASWAKIK